ncbi:MAG: nitroreductase family protein [Bacteroidales bacterium]
MKRKFNLSEVLNIFLVLAIIVIFMMQRWSEPSNSATYTPKNTEEIVLKNIHQRKSVRNFVSHKMVSKQDLITLMKAGMAAPTAKNQQPWEFIAVTKVEEMEALAQKLPYAKMLQDAGGAIVVCGDLKQAKKGSVEAFWVQDCSAATQNILLAAEAMGLGAVWTGVYPTDRVKIVKEILSIPSDVIPLCVIPVGYPTGKDQPKDKFKEDKIHWEKY